MNLNRLTFLCEKILEKCNGDSLLALATISASVDSFLALGQYDNADKMGRVLAHFRRFYC